MTVTAALAAVRLDDGVGGMRRNFERAVAYLLPTGPIVKGQKDKKRGAAATSEAEGTQPNGGTGQENSVRFKVSKGSTGVEYCYHQQAEFDDLTPAQKKQLKAHQKANGNYEGVWKGESEAQNTQQNRDEGNEYTTKAQVASLLKDHDNEEAKKDTERKERTDEIRAEIAALLKSAGQNATVAGTGARQCNRADASVGEVTATIAAGRKSPMTNEQANEEAEAFLDRLSDKFAAMYGQQSKENSWLNASPNSPLAYVICQWGATGCTKPGTWVPLYVVMGHYDQYGGSLMMTEMATEPISEFLWTEWNFLLFF